MGFVFFRIIIALAGRAVVIAMPVAALPLCVGAEGACSCVMDAELLGSNAVGGLIAVVAAFVGGILPTDGTSAVVDARPLLVVVSTWETDAGLEAAVIISGFDSSDEIPRDSFSLWWCCRGC